MTDVHERLEAIVRMCTNAQENARGASDEVLSSYANIAYVAGQAAAALSQSGAGGVVAWPIETDDQVEALARECEWDNRKYMTPADYAIWCERMRKFARLSALAASPSAGEPVALKGDAKEIVDRLRAVTGSTRRLCLDAAMMVEHLATPPAPVQTASVEAVLALIAAHEATARSRADKLFEMDLSATDPGVASAFAVRNKLIEIGEEIRALTAPTQGATTPAASNPQSACAGEEAGQAAGEAHRAPAATPSSPVSSPSPAGGVREALVIARQAIRSGGDTVKAIAAIDAALSSPATGEVVEAIAAWLEKQRSEVPAHGWEFAAALRAGGPDLAALNPAPGHGEGGL